MDIFTSLWENEQLSKGLWSLVWLFLIIVIIKVINGILYRSIDDNSHYYLLRKRIYYIFSTIYVVIFISLWINSAGDLATYVGLVSAGVAVSLRDMFANIAGWMFIIMRKPFEVGDRIEIDGLRGDVIDVRMFQFAFMEVSQKSNGEQSTGRIIDMPNQKIFTEPVTNYQKGFRYIWNEIDVIITFESDWRLAKKRLEAILERQAMHLSGGAQKQLDEAARKYMIHYNKLTPIVYTDVKTNGIQLTLRYLCDPKQRRTTINAIWEDILEMIAKETSIHLAYPTYRITE